MLRIVAMGILASETQLTGQWVVRDGHVVGDGMCERVGELIRSHLELLRRDQSGWEMLYRDPGDGRLWELTYPQGHMHGGGPPQLRWLTRAEAEAKYGTSVIRY